MDQSSEASYSSLLEEICRIEGQAISVEGVRVPWVQLYNGKDGDSVVILQTPEMQQWLNDLVIHDTPHHGYITTTSESFFYQGDLLITTVWDDLLGKYLPIQITCMMDETQKTYHEHYYYLFRSFYSRHVTLFPGVAPSDDIYKDIVAPSSEDVRVNTELSSSLCHDFHTARICKDQHKGFVEALLRHLGNIEGDDDDDMDDDNTRQLKMDYFRRAYSGRVANVLQGCKYHFEKAMHAAAKAGIMDKNGPFFIEEMLTSHDHEHFKTCFIMLFAENPEIKDYFGRWMEDTIAKLIFPSQHDSEDFFWRMVPQFPKSPGPVLEQFWNSVRTEGYPEKRYTLEQGIGKLFLWVRSLTVERQELLARADRPVLRRSARIATMSGASVCTTASPIARPDKEAKV